MKERQPRSRSQESIVEKAYWLARQRASLKLAKNAADSESRLAHYDLAGRYSVKAMSAEQSASDVADNSSPPTYADRMIAANDDA